MAKKFDTSTIPGAEFEFATVASIQERIEHLTWILAPGRFCGQSAGDLRVELEMLKFQWLGNAEIRERQMGARS